MKTEIIRADGLAQAARLLQDGALVAVPTETVYGLAANGLDEAAVDRIYAVKGRPAVKPLSLMVSGAEEMERYCDPVPEAARILAARFWPGPLTIVLRSRELVPALVRAGGETVGLRCPDHILTRALLRLTGLPFAAPSANPSGAASPKSAREVLDYFDGRIEAVVDGGPCELGTESTLIDMSRLPYRVLRRGALSEREIAAALVDGMTLIGITGPSGSGKTTALRELEKRGALILDCDAVYHKLLESDGALLGELSARFPEAFDRGVLSRRKLAALVFSDPAALADLNALSHRHITQEVQRRLEDWAMRGGTLAALDAVELISSGLGARCRFTIGILAAREIRIERIMARDGISRGQAELRVDAQRPDRYYVDNCTHTLVNNGDAVSFIIKMSELLEGLLNHGRTEKQALL